MSGISYGTRSFAGFQHHQGAAPRSPSEYGMPQMGMGSRPVSQLDLPRLASGSRLSLAPTQYSPGWSGNGSDGHEMQDMLPTDDAILAEIRDVLRTADLMTVTKKSVKNELERRFGVPLDAKRAYIGSATEAVISGQL